TPVSSACPGIDSTAPLLAAIMMMAEVASTSRGGNRTTTTFRPAAAPLRPSAGLRPRYPASANGRTGATNGDAERRGTGCVGRRGGVAARTRWLLRCGPSVVVGRGVVRGVVGRVAVGRRVVGAVVGRLRGVGGALEGRVGRLGGQVGGERRPGGVADRDRDGLRRGGAGALLGRCHAGAGDAEAGEGRAEGEDLPSGHRAAPP